MTELIAAATLISWHPGLLSGEFFEFVNEITHFDEDHPNKIVTVNTGVYEHLFVENQNTHDKSRDIFYLKEFELEDVEKFIYKIGKYVEDISNKTGRSFFFSSVVKVDETTYKMYWDS